MSIAHWTLFAGLIFMAMMLIGTLLARLPLSGAMVYLGLGILLGPYGAAVITLGPLRHAEILETVTEAALLISLFSSGLKLEVPMLDRRWIPPLRLVLGSMCITVGLMAAIGVLALGLPLGAAVLMGAMLAPTDPVLASAIQSEPGPSPDPIRFSLAGEGALNDGTAFPFVLLGLGLMGLHDLGTNGWHWWAVDLLWSTVGGSLIGAAVGAVIGKLVIFLRTRHHNAIGLDLLWTGAGLSGFRVPVCLLCRPRVKTGARSPDRWDCSARQRSSCCGRRRRAGNTLSSRQRRDDTRSARV